MSDLQEAIATIEQLTLCMNNASEIITQWIPSAEDAEEAELCAIALEYNVRVIEGKFVPWKEIITNAYKEGKSVPAYERMVALGLIEAEKV